MKFLITGANGFIGTHLRKELEDAGHDVYSTDLAYGGDLREKSVAESAFDSAGVKFDYVIHLAAQVGRLFGEDDVAHTITNNALATARVAQACASRGVKLAYCSTSEVYGDQGETVCTEDGGMKLPHNLYGLTKRFGEEIAQLYAPDGLVIFRLSMPYGPGLPYGRGRAAMINFLHQAITRQPIPVHRGAERAWCFVGDTVRGLRMILEHPENAGAWNVGRDDAMPLRETAAMACDLVGAPHSLIQDVDPPAAQTVVKRLSMDKLRSIGWTPQVTLEEGMARTLAFVEREMEAEVAVEAAAG